MPPPELVIFDCDGVLVDTERPVMAVMADNLSRYGPHLSIEDCADLFFGGTIAGAAEKIRSIGYALPDNWLDEAYDAMFERLRQGVDLVPGIELILDALDAAAIPYCVGSNGPMAKMEITLKPSGLWDRLAGRIFSAHTIGLQHAKPAPDLFLHATENMGVSPERAVVIEDSVSGVTAAVAAGIPCYGYCAGSSHMPLVAAGATTFDAMPELLTLLDLEP